MTTVYHPLPESYVNITRPVNIIVTNRIKELCGIKDKDFRVSYYGVAGGSKSLGSTTGLDQGSPESIFGFTGKFNIDVREEYSELAQHLGKTKVSSRPPIFHDPAIRVSLEPLYHAMETTIAVTYRTQDYNAARSFADHFRSRMDSDTNVHSLELEYQYPIDPATLMLLKKIHTLREAKGGYGETWNEWFYGHTANRVDVLTKMDGKGGLVSFQEKQINVLGWFEETTSPDPQAGEAGTYEVSFNYKYRYDRPAELRVTYPVTVHNSVLPRDLLPSNTTNYVKMVGERSNSEALYGYINKANGSWIEDIDGVKIPSFDDYRLPNLDSGSVCLLRVLLKVSEIDPTEVISLRELGSYSISERLIRHLIDTRDRVTYVGSEAFAIQLLRNQSVMNPSAIKLDENGVITTTSPMDVRSVYHLRVVMLENLSRISSDGLKALSRDPELATDILLTLGISESDLPNTVANKILPRPDIVALYSKLNPVIKHISDLTPNFIPWVGKFIINTHGEK